MTNTQDLLIERQYIRWKIMNKKVELLAPAGDLERLKIAYLYGADAVYIGGKKYSMRANAKNFTITEIKKACTFAHNLRKKLYVTVNITFHNEDYEDLVSYLKTLSFYGVDAIIISDLSIIDIIKENNIKLPIHISTQLSISNTESTKYLKKQGVERIVLSRECSKQDIQTIIKDTGMEIECFLHGAMCSSYSGRCVLSNYFTQRDANRGACAQICRWCFDLYDEHYHQINNQLPFMIACKDLCLINNLKEMIEIGIKSFKVEGRMRSNYYIATVISTYREAIDLYYQNKLTKKTLEHFQKVLNRVANRESTSQFFDKFPDHNAQYYQGRQEVSNQDFLGIVESYDPITSYVTINQRNYFKPGDDVEIFGPSIETFSFKIPEIFDENNNPLEVARHPKQTIKFKLNKKVYPNDIMRVKIS